MHNMHSVYVPYYPFKNRLYVTHVNVYSYLQ